VLGVRSERTSFFRQPITQNFLLIVSVLLTFGLQLAIIYIPVLQEVFSTQALTLNEMLTCIGLSSLVLIAVEVEKLARRRREVI
jgi:Ca2+-transporting ATPase